MTEQPPVKDQARQHYGNADASALERYENGEIDIFTLVQVLPESAIPAHIASAYRLLTSLQENEDAKASDERKRDAADQAQEFLEMVEQWRMDRGPGYVQAYVEFRKTGDALESGQGVFESDWFRQLQEARQEQITQLERKAATGRLTSQETAKWRDLVTVNKSDQEVAESWKSLRQDYQKLKARESSRGMSEEELRLEGAKLRERLFVQLDKASPELREQLINEISANDPRFRREYEARNSTQPVVSNAHEIELAANLGHSADSVTQELTGDLLEMERGSSTAKKYGFETVAAGVDMRRSFSGATENVAVADSKEPGLGTVHGNKPLTPNAG